MSDWPVVKLSTLLNDGQIEEVTRILNSKEDPMDAVHELKMFLRSMRAQLERKGVLPDYLAYAIAYKASTMK